MRESDVMGTDLALLIGESAILLIYANVLEKVDLS